MADQTPWSIWLEIRARARIGDTRVGINQQRLEQGLRWGLEEDVRPVEVVDVGLSSATANRHVERHRRLMHITAGSALGSTLTALAFAMERLL